MKTKQLVWIMEQLRKSPDHRVTGYLGELLVMELLKATRWRAYQPTARKIGDLLVTDMGSGERLKVEVKTARRDKRGHWQFCLWKRDRHGVTDSRHADVVVLLCVDDGNVIYPYVVPQSFLGDRRKVEVCSHPTIYRGRLADFRQELRALSLDTQRLNQTVATYYGYAEVRYAAV